MLWLSAIFAAVSYGGALLAPEMPFKILCLFFGIPGVVTAFFGMRRRQNDSLGAIVLLSVNMITALSAAVLFGFFAWMFIAAGPATI